MDNFLSSSVAVSLALREPKRSLIFTMPAEWMFQTGSPTGMLSPVSSRSFLAWGSSSHYQDMTSMGAKLSLWDPTQTNILEGSFIISFVYGLMLPHSGPTWNFKRSEGTTIPLLSIEYFQACLALFELVSENNIQAQVKGIVVVNDVGEATVQHARMMNRDHPNDEPCDS